MDPFLLMVLVIVVAVVFEYINGFHDAANSIATVVSTKVLTPRQAILLAAERLFAGAALQRDVDGAADAVVSSAVGGGLPAARANSSTRAAACR